MLTCHRRKGEYTIDVSDGKKLCKETVTDMLCVTVKQMVYIASPYFGYILTDNETVRPKK